MKAAGDGCGCAPGARPGSDAQYFLDAESDLVIAVPHDAATINVASDANGVDAPFTSADAGPPESPPTPEAPTFDFYTELPCGFPASFELRNDDGVKKLRTTCGLWPLGLFETTIDDDGSPSSWERLDDPENVDGLPANHLSLSDGFAIVNHSAPDGLTVIAEATGTISDIFLFEDATPSNDTDGNPLDFPLTYPAGMGRAGGILCVATSNFDDATFSYHDATVTLIPYGDGRFDRDNIHVVRSPGQNGTSVNVNDGWCHVLAANNFSPAAGELASLNLLDPVTFATESFPITISDTPLATRAQIAGRLAITSLGQAVFALEAPYRWVTVVDTVNGETAFHPLDETYDPETWSYFTSTLLYDDRITIASDYGLLATPEGRVHFVDISPYGWAGSITSPTEGVTGPAAIDEDEGVLYQAITDENGNGQLLRASLADL